MKKAVLILVALSVVFFTIAMALAADATIVNGYVSDSMCGAKGNNAGHAACMTKCLSKGAKAVIVTDADSKVLAVENPEVLKGHEAHHVAVTGHVNGDSIHIESVKML